MLAFVSLIVLLTAVTNALPAPVHRLDTEPPLRDQTSVMSLEDAIDCVDTSATPSELVVDPMTLLYPVPVDNAKAIWSTSPLSKGYEPLNDKSLNIYDGKSTPHYYESAPDGTPAVRAFYQKGSTSPGHTPAGIIGGFSLYSKTGIDLSSGTELLFSYKAWFEKGFDFKKGGKMPGFYAGVDDTTARRCSGGSHHEGKCWSSRMMFRRDGAGELYAYFPQTNSNKDALSSVKPRVVHNDAYGTSVGRGSFVWATDAWTAITQRIKLNDIGENNGEFQVWVDGTSIMNISGLSFRTDDASRVRGLQLQTFMGGHDETWAAPHDQSTWFKDFSAVILA